MILSTIIFSVSFVTVSVYASDYTEYSFSGINLKVKVPNELIVFTRHTTNNNAYLELIGASDAASLRTMMEKNNIYLEAVDENATYEIAIIGHEVNDESKNYSEYNEDELNILFDDYIENQTQLSESNEELTEQIRNASIETINGIPFFVTDLSSVNTALNTIYVKKYHSIVNGYEYDFAIQSRAIEINSTMTDNLNYILESAEYVKVKKSLFDNGVFTEIFTIVITAAIPIVILIFVVFLLQHFGRKNHNKLTSEEAKLREEYNKTHNI